MVYSLKIQDCPFRSPDGKCTHKEPVRNKNKKTRSCGYSDVKMCRMYNESHSAAKEENGDYNEEAL